MNSLYAMQRANGDWFTIKDDGRLRVPVFHTSSDAMQARARNLGMLLFKPVALDQRALGELAETGESAADFLLVTDPSANFKLGRPLKHEQLVLLVLDRAKQQAAPQSDTGSDLSSLHSRPRNAGSATETWEDEGGKSSSKDLKL
ncbi:MAG: hypothetical protein WCB68_11540 [Pyrinomonadaceae bacterium]